MPIETDIPRMEPTRQERLHLWSRRSGLSQAAVARHLGISPTSFGRWLRAERLPVRNVAMMRDLGMPEEPPPLVTVSLFLVMTTHLFLVKTMK